MRSVFNRINVLVALLAVVSTAAVFAQTKPATQPAAPTTAEETVTAMVKAAIEQDIAGAEAYMDAEWIAQCNMIYKKKGGVKGYWARLTKDFTTEKFALLPTGAMGEFTMVPVTLERKDGSTMTSAFRCQKKDGRWVVLGN